MVEGSGAVPLLFMTSGTARERIGVGCQPPSSSFGTQVRIPVASSVLSTGQVRAQIPLSKGQPASPNEPKGLSYQELIDFLTEQRPRQLNPVDQQDLRALLPELADYIRSGPFSRDDIGVLERKITRLQEQLS